MCCRFYIVFLSLFCALFPFVSFCNQSSTAFDIALGHFTGRSGAIDNHAGKTFLYRACQENDPRAWALFSLFLDSGSLGFKRDSDNAQIIASNYFGAVLALSDNNCSDAKFLVGKFYARGLCVDKDLDKAHDYYLSAAHMGNSVAMSHLATLLYNKNNNEDGSVQIFDWLKQSASNGYVNAIRQMAFCYEHGIGVSRDLNESIVLYKEAAEKGSTTAAADLANVYLYGLKETNNYAQAFALLNQAADLDDHYAMAVLGHAYLDDSFGQSKDHEGYHLIKKSTEGDCPQGWAALGIIYTEGILFDADYEYAFECFLKGQDLSAAQRWLGYLYLNGLGVEANSAEAIKWYSQAARDHNPNAMLDLADIYQHGSSGIDESIGEAIYWYQMAASLGVEEAILSLADIYHSLAGEGVYSNSYEWIRGIFESGEPFLVDQLAGKYDTGKYTKYKKHQLLDWVLLFANAGSARAMYDAASIFSAQNDLSSAVIWYDKASQAGIKDASHKLGIMYLLGKAVGRDYDKSREHLKKSGLSGQLLSILPFMLKYWHIVLAISLVCIICHRRCFFRTAK